MNCQLQQCLLQQLLCPAWDTFVRFKIEYSVSKVVDTSKSEEIQGESGTR